MIQEKRMSLITTVAFSVLVYRITGEVKDTWKQRSQSS